MRRSRPFYICRDYVLSFCFSLSIYFAAQGEGEGSRVTRLEWEEAVGVRGKGF